MRGRPLLRIALVLLGIAIMSLPVYNLTRERYHAAQRADSTTAQNKELRISVAFTHPPGDYAITYLGQPVLSGHGPSTEFSGVWSTAIPKEGIDLLFKAHWPGNHALTAVNLKVGTDDSVLVNVTWWARNELTELATVPSS